MLKPKKNYILAAEIYISNAEMYIPAGEIYISRREMKFMLWVRQVYNGSVPFFRQK